MYNCTGWFFDWSVLKMTKYQTDMRFVKNFTLPDFRAKNLTLLILPNFNSFGDNNTKNEWKWKNLHRWQKFFTAAGSANLTSGAIPFGNCDTFAILTLKTFRGGPVKKHPVYYLEGLLEYRIILFFFQNLIAHEGQGSIGGREGVGSWWADDLLLIKVLGSKDRMISETWGYKCMKTTNFGSGRIE